jgi:IrrE N-terminal-like domain
MPSRYRSPQSLFKELGISEPEDIRIEAIAQYCRASVRYKTLEGCQARIIGYGDRAIISVNNSSHRHRQRFSIGHELGHWMCDQGIIAFSCGEKVFATEWSTDNPERRANRYAADILLPEFMFRPLVKNQEITFATVRELAKRFETSLIATTIRLVELSSFPCMVVCNGQRKRRWFFREKDVSLWPLEHPGQNTIAYDLLHRVDYIQSPTDVCADGWIEHPDAHRYELREDSVRMSMPDGTILVLSLLWWKNEQQLLDLEEEY